jgi:MFS family permease
MYVAWIAGSMAVFTAFVLIAPYAKDSGATAVVAALFAGIAGAASIAGRLGAIVLSGRHDLLAVYRASVLGIAASLLIVLPTGGSIVAIGIFAVVFGTTYGGFASLSPPVVARVVGPRELGSALGVAYTAVAFGSFLGPPIAGAAIDVTGRYEPAIALTLGLTIATLVLLQPLGRSAADTQGSAELVQPRAA